MISLPRRDGRAADLLAATFDGLAVFGAGKIGIDLSGMTAGVAAVWFANAIPLAIMLVRPRREWWPYAAATAIGNLAVNLLHGDGLLLSLGIAGCNVGEVVVAAGLLHRLRAVDILGSLRALLLFFGVGVGLSCGLAAALGAVFVSHALPMPYLTVWPTWWIADAVGMIVVTPALIVLLRGARHVRLTPRAFAEFAVIAAGLAAATHLASDNVLAYSMASWIALKAVLPLMIWAAVRFGRGGATLANLLMIAVSIGTVIVGGHGSADAAALLDSLEAAQLRLLTMAAVALLLATLLEERRSAMARLNDAIESMSESFALFDADDRLVLANSRHRQAYAHGNPLFTIGTRFEDIIRGGIALGQHPEALGREEEWVAERMRRHHDSDRPFEQHLGDERWEKISERRTSDGGIVGVWTDITDLKRQELQLRATEARARAAEQALREAIENIHNGFVLFDADDRLTACNEEYQAIHGSLAGMIKPGVTFEEIIRASAAAGHIARAVGRSEDWVAERMALHRNPQGPFEHPLTDGRWMLIDERRTSDGGIVGIRTDITRLKQQEQALREREEQLKATIAKLEQSEAELQGQAGILRGLASESAEQRERAVAASRAKSDFLAMMSHEIRSPLNGIIGNTDLLLDSPLAPSQRRSADVVRQCGTALITVIDDILDFSKIEAGKLDLAYEDFNLEESLEAVASMTRVAAQNKGLKLAVAIAADVPRGVKGDENRLRQVLLNLVANAVKFTETGSIDIGVERASASADCVVIRFTVRDTGVGIPLEAQAHLFDAFYQVDGSYRRKAGGTGLGLAICRRLAHLMGGEIGVESLPGMGSRFWFTAELGRSERQVSRSATSDGVADSGAPARILLVDDLDVNRDIAEALLTQAGHSVDMAADGAEAVAAVVNNDYDLVLMDIQMPVMDGFEATARIRSLPAPKRSIPIIAMTAYATRQDIQHCVVLGMNGHIAKPIERKTLLAAVRSRATGTAPAAQTAADIDACELLSTAVLNDLELGVGRQEVVRFATAIRTRVEVAVEQLRDDAIAGRFAEIETMAHKLLSATGCAGMKRLSAQFSRLQELAARARAGDPVDVIEAIERTEEIANESIPLLLRQVPECGHSAARTPALAGPE
jgi:signal transduction histidine kinase/DNA-binding response OmpR family regulator/integral membrane sensor domain MASE1